MITIDFCLFLNGKRLYTSFFQWGPAYLMSVPGENLFCIQAPVWWLNFHCQFCGTFRWAAAPDDVSVTALPLCLPSYVFSPFPLLVEVEEGVHVQAWASPPPASVTMYLLGSWSELFVTTVFSWANFHVNFWVSFLVQASFGSGLKIVLLTDIISPH